MALSVCDHVTHKDPLGQGPSREGSGEESGPGRLGSQSPSGAGQGLLRGCRLGHALLGAEGFTPAHRSRSPSPALPVSELGWKLPTVGSGGSQRDKCALVGLGEASGCRHSGSQGQEGRLPWACHTSQHSPRRRNEVGA